MKISENTWNKAEQNMARRERVRYLKTRRITLSAFPNVLVPTADGSWRFPSLKAS